MIYVIKIKDAYFQKLNKKSVRCGKGLDGARIFTQQTEAYMMAEMLEKQLDTVPSVITYIEDRQPTIDDFRDARYIENKTRPQVC